MKSDLSRFNSAPESEVLKQVFFIDDDEDIRLVVEQTLTLADMCIKCFASAEECLPLVHENWPGVIVTDLHMPSMDGMMLFRQLNELDPELPIILLTGHGDISTAVTAIRAGVYDYIEKPFSQTHFVDVIHRALEKRSLTLENRSLREEIFAQGAPGPRILGNTSVIKQLRRLVQQVMDAPADILLQGETGCGKELIARFLHEHSVRQAHPFVAINCGALPEALVESELFGHTQGAFTGASKSRKGKFEYANGGTLFLDEIESMPVNLQVKLLRVLEERQVERLGTNELIPIDIRVIAATKENLKKRSEEGLFRLDLYYRLNVVTINIPALRDRKEDILLLFQHFTSLAGARYGHEVIPLSLAQRQALLNHDWPGNVRELRNIAERYVLLGESAEFDIDGWGAISSSLIETEKLTSKVEAYERALLEDALIRHQGRLKTVMDELGLARKTLYDKLKKHGLNRAEYSK
ncbi:sigma-54-dependent transcriptional regulator [Zooshikella ganghwensis]|uniref:Sigma-54-dependent Fis family transcriptional regulator n=1 Tax=Zooshikella ganghwensis TaxID=202772 RepID=A0A4P9VP19_9GAMM|nr:sigma-54 dependent transcriptional regulator [Zooshikella ganghwensis]RDH45225.1 sigma-54-dependent Fis family transcriptional regulator [Zooshikella ganghwensis]